MRVSMLNRHSGVRAVIHLGYTRYQVAGKYYGYDPDTHYFDGFDAFRFEKRNGRAPNMFTTVTMNWLARLKATRWVLSMPSGAERCCAKASRPPSPPMEIGSAETIPSAKKSCRSIFITVSFYNTNFYPVIGIRSV